jgi:ectoine hydroxylase-related dioxygenase (phytanoyl-CoA dioxygenase family)
MDSLNLKDLKKDFNEQGYVVIPSVITVEECDNYKSLLEDNAQQYTPDYFSSKAKTQHGLEDKSSEKVVFNLHNKELAYYDLIDHPIVRSVLDVVLKEGSYHDAEPYILTNSSARCPLKGSKGQQLHLDSRLPGGHFPLMVVALWMLDDFSEENGGTRVIPKSHMYTSFADNNKKYPEEVVVDAKKGSVLIFNGSLWHGSSDKISDKDRWGVIISYGRWFLKPSFDIYNNMPSSIYDSISESQKELLGYKVCPPKDEFTRNRRLSEDIEPPNEYHLPS